MDILFATTNKGKISTARRYMEAAGVTITPIEMDLIEPQSDSLEEIAVSKARQAFNKLGKPVMVQDSSIVIPSLNDFPGPYAKYFIDVLGVEGFVKLMKGHKDRTTLFYSVLAYADKDGNIKTFNEISARGTISHEVSQKPLRENAWSPFWRIYIPEGYDKVLNDMCGAELAHYYANRSKKSYFTDFAHWLTSQDTAQHKSYKTAPKKG